MDTVFKALKMVEQGFDFEKIATDIGMRSTELSKLLTGRKDEAGAQMTYKKIRPIIRQKRMTVEQVYDKWFKGPVVIQSTLPEEIGADLIWKVLNDILTEQKKTNDVLSKVYAPILKVTRVVNKELSDLKREAGYAPRWTPQEMDLLVQEINDKSDDVTTFDVCKNVAEVINKSPLSVRAMLHRLIKKGRIQPHVSLTKTKTSDRIVA